MPPLPAPRHEPTGDAYMLLGISDYYLKRVKELAMDTYLHPKRAEVNAAKTMQLVEYALCRTDSPGHACLAQDETRDRTPSPVDVSQRELGSDAEAERV